MMLVRSYAKVSESVLRITTDYVYILHVLHIPGINPSKPYDLIITIITPDSGPSQLAASGALALGWP